MQLANALANAEGLNEAQRVELKRLAHRLRLFDEGAVQVELDELLPTLALLPKLRRLEEGDEEDEGARYSRRPGAGGSAGEPDARGDREESDEEDGARLARAPATGAGVVA